MKSTPLFALGFGLLSLVGCATAPQAAHDAPRRAPGTAAMAEIAPSSSADLNVISAVYGSGDKFADVTLRVNDLLRQPKAYFWAKPEWLLADPAPGWNKALVVVFELNGRRQIFATGEGGTVSASRLRESAEEADAAPKKGAAVKKPKKKAAKKAPENPKET